MCVFFNNMCIFMCISFFLVNYKFFDFIKHFDKVKK